MMLYIDQTKRGPVFYSWEELEQMPHRKACGIMLKCMGVRIDGTTPRSVSVTPHYKFNYECFQWGEE